MIDLDLEIRVDGDHVSSNRIDDVIPLPSPVSFFSLGVCLG
jgi:hypothetical protein